MEPSLLYQAVVRLRDCNAAMYAVSMPISRALVLVIGQAVTALVLLVPSICIAAGIPAALVAGLCITAVIALSSTLCGRPSTRSWSCLRDWTDSPSEIRNAFCCAIRHVHPVTGVYLPCDRELIYSALRRWFCSSTTEAEDEVLDRFDALCESTCVGARESLRHP